eukprot:CAMPEP_0116003442 /NCGR_PEP_ID=MMETSP0321-20121206/58_1 /TAXON_ID=163516 /ORGANISM="Leptocylindrus danicus var. danicus, Strain B650" /LENGTH=499 /DNA_ID=CAMNT_0003471651 /DNA_START=167 /DNA_END=1665 /DNA_ORIENTATION=-
MNRIEEEEDYDDGSSRDSIDGDNDDDDAICRLEEGEQDDHDHAGQQAKLLEPIPQSPALSTYSARSSSSSSAPSPLSPESSIAINNEHNDDDDIHVDMDDIELTPAAIMPPQVQHGGVAAPSIMRSCLRRSDTAFSSNSQQAAGGGTVLRSFGTMREMIAQIDSNMLNRSTQPYAGSEAKVSFCRDNSARSISVSSLADSQESNTRVGRGRDSIVISNVLKLRSHSRLTKQLSTGTNFFTRTQNPLTKQLSSPGSSFFFHGSQGRSLKQLNAQGHKDSTVHHRSTSTGTISSLSGPTYSLSLRIKVQEFLAYIIAKDICFCTCAIAMKENDITMSLAGSMVKDLMDKWLIPKKSRFVFQTAATSMMFSVGQKAIQQHGIEKILELRPRKFHNILEPVLASMGDEDTMKLWLANARLVDKMMKAKSSRQGVINLDASSHERVENNESEKQGELLAVAVYPVNDLAIDALFEDSCIQSNASLLSRALMDANANSGYKIILN